MTELKFSIEGENAITATEELLAIEGITGNYSVDSEDVKKKQLLPPWELSSVLWVEQ